MALQRQLLGKLDRSCRFHRPEDKDMHGLSDILKMEGGRDIYTSENVDTTTYGDGFSIDVHLELVAKGLGSAEIFT